MNIICLVLLAVLALTGCSTSPPDPETLQAEAIGADLSALYPEGRVDVDSPYTTHFIENVRYGASVRMMLPLSAAGAGDDSLAGCSLAVDRLVADGWSASSSCSADSFEGCASALLWREYRDYGSDLHVWLCSAGGMDGPPGTGPRSEQFILEADVFDKAVLDMYRDS